MSNQYVYGAELLKKYEGFNRVAVWDVNAYRIGYGSDTITNSNGQYRKVVKGDQTTEQLAAKDLQRRIKEFEQKLIRQVGKEYWEPLNYQVKAALISLAYNYGGFIPSLTKTIEAIQTGNNKKIATAILNETKNHNKSKSENVRAALYNRRKKEAAIIEAAPQSNGTFNKKLLLIPIALVLIYIINKKT
jgi:GH24 family phage-related lysozyme (muramidase)